MKFTISDQYPDKWIHGNLQEKPLEECFLGKDDDGREDWYLNIKNLNQLVELAKRKKQNLFINFNSMEIIFTYQDSPE